MPSLISVLGDVVQIERTEFADALVADYLRDSESEKRAAAIQSCLHLGVSVIRFGEDKHGSMLLAETLNATAQLGTSTLEATLATTREELAKTRTELTEAIKLHVDGFRAEVSKTFDPSLNTSAFNALSAALSADMRRVTDKLQGDLDMRNPTSPFSLLRSEQKRDHEAVVIKFAELAQHAATKAAVAAERSRSTRKGEDLESALDQFFVAECGPRKDMVRRTSTELGIDGNRVGDFVIEINPSEAKGARIAIEAKNAEASTTALLRELDKAMHNRGASFGIAVVGNTRADSPAIMPFGDDKLIVRVATLEERGWDMLALSVALEGARWKSVIGRSARDVVDLSRIVSDVDEAFRIINRVTEIKKRITAGKTQLDTIAEGVDEMRRDLVSVLQRLRDGIKGPSIGADAA